MSDGFSPAELAEMRQYFQRERRAAEPQAAAAETLASAYAQIAAHPAGDIVLRDLLLNVCAVLTTPHVPGDAYATHVELGRHQVGLEIIKRLKWSTSELQKLGEGLTQDMLRRVDSTAPAATAEEDAGE